MDSMYLIINVYTVSEPAIAIWIGLNVYLSTRKDRRIGFIVPGVYLIATVLFSLATIIIKYTSDIVDRTGYSYGINIAVLAGFFIFQAMIYFECRSFLKRKKTANVNAQVEDTEIRDL